MSSYLELFPNYCTVLVIARLLSWRWEETRIRATQRLVVTICTLIGLNLPALTSAILTTCAVEEISVVRTSTSGESCGVMVYLCKIKQMRVFFFIGEGL